jgi:hypothetical protein
MIVCIEAVGEFSHKLTDGYQLGSLHSTVTLLRLSSNRRSSGWLRVKANNFDANSSLTMESRVSSRFM